MSRRPDPQQGGTRPVLGEPLGEDNAQALIGDYLDYLCTPLLGIVPYAQRRRLRAEAEDHLHLLAEDFEAEGFSPAEAAAVALREYGEPWQVGQDWAEAWLCGAAPSRLFRPADAATLRAFGWFGVFTVLNLLTLETWALEPSQVGILPLIPCLAVVSPVAAGALTGIELNSRTNVGICLAMVLLGLASAAVGLLLLPRQEGLIFSAFQFVFWLPVGCLSATVAANLRRQFRLQGFRHTVR